MTVMSEGLLLNSKYIKMGPEEGSFQTLLTQLPLVIVCHELIIWRLTIKPTNSKTAISRKVVGKSAKALWVVLSSLFSDEI